MRAGRGALAAFLLALAGAAPLRAFDLGAATIERLENGLTVLILEDHALPLVSTQVLYRVGARNETTGKTGLAHFLEHMGFRATERFPATEVASRIYAVGGDWHAYTWIDQTTYFETVPKEELELVLAIQAERMAHLSIPAGEVEAERGAVLSELHGYENDPAAVLSDAVLATVFLAHPYRHNTIGWESDVAELSHQDLVDFYRRHYHPANAILAVVGDVATEDVLARVRRHFGALPARAPTAPPSTIEPPQRGERRVELLGTGLRSYFQISYRAPAAAAPDFPSFLLLQALLGGSSGVNFLQDEGGSAVAEESRLAAAAPELTTWFPASADSYVFTLAGSCAAADDPAQIEAEIERRIGVLREQPPETEELERARAQVLRALVFDLETGEEAAHQLAFFEGLGARAALLALPERVAAVTPIEVQQLARSYLQPWQRTIGWYRAGAAPLKVEPALSSSAPRDRAGLSAPRSSELPPVPWPGSAEPARGGSAAPATRPRVIGLGHGLPVLFEPLPGAATAHLRLLVPNTTIDFGEVGERDEPVWRYTSLSFSFLPGELAETLRKARQALAQGTTSAAVDFEALADPETWLENGILAALGGAPSAGEAAPRLLVLAGDFDEKAALAALETAFGDLAPAAPPVALDLKVRPEEQRFRFDGLAQARMAYLVPAPPPGSRDGRAMRLLLYVWSHGYEGRLGREAIGRRGLLYSISSAYRSDGRASWIELRAGVDPKNLTSFRELLQASIRELASAPVTAGELAEAKRHLLGRRVSAARSPAERTALWAREWIEEGRLLTVADDASSYAEIAIGDLQKAAKQLLAGATVIVAAGEEIPSSSALSAPR